MELHRFKAIKAQVASKATAEQLIELEEVVRLVIARQLTEVALARRTNATVESRICPHCAGHNVVLHGKDKNGRQRFRCRGCRRTYNILTGTPLARARKPDKWSTYLGYMTNHLSVRKIVEAGIGVHHVTVWRWRHRFLKAAVKDNASVLSGVIEADETFFRRSFKGHRGWKRGMPPADRAARPRAWGAHLRGLSHEQVPVLTALDNTGCVFESVLPSLASIEEVLKGRIAAGSVLCSDGSKAYVNAAVTAGAEHRRVITPTITSKATKTNPVPTKRRRKGRLGLGRVNAHHGQIKTLINIRCRGVATKYLDKYLGWNRAMRRPGFQGKVLLEKALA